jgi:hypothetical protein
MVVLKFALPTLADTNLLEQPGRIRKQNFTATRYGKKLKGFARLI